jgi:hypothetical protein
MSGGQGSSDGIIHLRGKIVGGKLVSLLDHAGNEIGAPVTVVTNEVTGMVTISGPSGSPIQMYLTQTQYNALVAAGQIVSTCLYITSGA